jgi:hypothetical protein
LRSSTVGIVARKTSISSAVLDTFFIRLRNLRPDERVTRIRNFSWLLSGLYKSRSVHLSKIAEKIPGTACLPRLTRRIRRLLDNPAVRVREWYEPIVRTILVRLADGEIRLIVDGSKVGFGHQLLLVAIAYRRRAIPLAWTWVKSSRGHSSVHKQKALLAYIHSLIPAESKVLLVGDAEFGEVEVQKLLQKWHWKYVLRQKGRHLLLQKGQCLYQRLDSLVKQPGHRIERLLAKTILGLCTRVIAKMTAHLLRHLLWIDLGVNVQTFEVVSAF